MVPVFSCFVRSKRVKTCYLQAQPATPRAMWHPRPKCRRSPLQKGFLSAGKLADTATDIVVDEKQLISWARTNRAKKKMKKTNMSVSTLKQQVARSENDARFAAADRNRVASDRVASHISTYWIAAQKPGSTVKISFPCLIFTRRLLSRDRDRRCNWPHTERRQKYRTRSRKKCPVGASKHGRSG